MMTQRLEDDLFTFLCHKYVQRQNPEQAEMGLQYTHAETRDLARMMAAYFIGRLDASLFAALEAADRKGSEDG